jgi:hypothetical protein
MLQAAVQPRRSTTAIARTILVTNNNGIPRNATTYASSAAGACYVVPTG